MQTLTKNQSDFLGVLRDFIKGAGRSPTISELQSVADKKGFCVKSKRSITQYLDALETKGHIQRTGQARGIHVLEPQNEVLLNIPILGMANAGVATKIAEEHFVGFLKVSKKLLKKKKDLFAIEVQGNSMNKAKVPGGTIESGDWVIVDKNNTSPKDGDYVLSVVEGLANVKKFFFDKKNNQVILVSESSEEHPPIYIHPDDAYLINGKVIQVIKKPRKK